LPAFLPTGISGVAESDDGLNWSRVRGPLTEGAVLRPSDDSAAFDYVHVGFTDIIPQTDGSYVALYLGGSADELSLGMGPGSIKGFMNETRHRIIKRRNCLGAFVNSQSNAGCG